MHDLPCSDNMKIDPQILRQLREERSWTQEHLAEAAGVSLRTIQRIEREGNASADSRLALAAAFGIDVSILAGKPEEPTDTTLRTDTADRPLDAQKGAGVGESFLRHLIVYLVVCSFLVYLDFSKGNEVHWSKWPLLGWGFGLLMHGLSAWSRPRRLGEEDALNKKNHRSFRDQLRIYVVMSAAFLVVDFLVNGKLTWALYPIGGWGLGLLLSYSKTTRGA